MVREATGAGVLEVIMHRCIRLCISQGLHDIYPIYIYIFISEISDACVRACVASWWSERVNALCWSVQSLYYSH